MKKTPKRGRKDPATKKPAGRPIEWTDERIEGERKLMMEWFGMKTKNHSLKKFAHSRGYQRQRLIEFTDISKEFSYSYKMCKEVCEDRIEEGLLNGTKNPAGSIFILKSNYDYIEKAEREKIELRRQEITVKKEDIGNTIHVHLDNIPSSDLVPHKE